MSRIIINLGLVRKPRRRVKVRTSWYHSGEDSLDLVNATKDVYDLIVGGLKKALDAEEFADEGERT